MNETQTPNSEIETDKSVPEKLKAHKSRMSKNQKVLAIVGAVVVVVGVLLAIPYTRYAMLSPFVKRAVTVEVLDSRTHKPVSDVEVTAGKAVVKTDASGRAKFAAVAVGRSQLQLSKKYYALQTPGVTVPVLGADKKFSFSFVAIGDQVTVTVINKLTGKPLAKASVKAISTATTDAKGQGVVVLPTKQSAVPGTITLAGYNDLKVQVHNAQSPAGVNTFALIPSGKIYFLSDRTGTMNVMKSDLDGSNAVVAVAGTGHENKVATSLMASPDRKYYALNASRDAGVAKLYLLDTTSDKLTLMDAGGATGVGNIGWSGDAFVYETIATVQPGENGAQSLKSYDAVNKKMTVLVQTAGDSGTQTEFAKQYGNQYCDQSIGQVYMIGGKIVYALSWTYHQSTVHWEYLYGCINVKKSATINSLKADGSDKQVIKSFDNPSGDGKPRWGLTVQTQPYIGLDSFVIKYAVSSDFAESSPVSFFKYQNGLVSAAPDVNDNNFYKYDSRAYLVSPSAKQTFWYEVRDGKNTLFTGDGNGGNPKTVATLGDFTPYGWYTDDYLLASKNNSELYIVPAGFSVAPTKISDFHL